MDVEMELRKGPWTVEEDLTLINYININGEGRWNSLAYHAGLKRTGKSCRLRWLNYLRPDVRRGNITLHEQLLILQLHSIWGNRWSKIAQYLPGRTDNEIKNYWRTRVQKQAKQLKCEVDSEQFRDTMRHLWIPTLLQRAQASFGSFPGQPVTTATPRTSYSINNERTDKSIKQGLASSNSNEIFGLDQLDPILKPKVSCPSVDSSESSSLPILEWAGCYDNGLAYSCIGDAEMFYGPETPSSPSRCCIGEGCKKSFEFDCGDNLDNLWNYD